jgi:hypothetical protein
MQPLYYFVNSLTNNLDTSPHRILAQVQKTSQGKFSQSFYNDKGELVETIKCILKNGIPRGPAIRKFPNGDSINFEFNNQGMMEGQALKKLAGGRIISFMFFKGLALSEEDKKYSEAALTPCTPCNEGMYPSQVSSSSPSSPTSISEIPTQMSNGKRLILDPNLLLETVYPRNSVNESALRFCHNGSETSIDLKVLVLRLYNQLKKRGIVLSEFNLIGGALQNILLTKKKKKGGDIDFLGFVSRENGGKVNPKEVLDIFSQVLEKMLFPHSSSSYEEKMARFTKKPYLLKAFLCNQDFMIATIPLQLQDPDNSTIMTSIDVDIRLNFENESSCIGSANCLKFNLLRGFLNESWRAIPVTAVKGYEQSVINAFQLLQKGLFFVHEPSAETTLNGLRAYIVLLVKGIFPCDYRSSWVYFVKWQKECEARGSAELGVNEFFQDLEKFLPRHYSMEGGKINLFYLTLYMINLRTVFALQDWSDSKWCYSKDEFLRIFDMKCLYLLRIPNIISQDHSLIKLLLFWKIASQTDRITPFSLSDSRHILALGNMSEGYGLMMEIPWRETFDCNWEELEKQLVGLQHYLQGMNLPSNTQELKNAISHAMANTTFATGVKNACLPEELHMQKMLQFAFHPTFNYAHFFSFLLEQINSNHTPAERAKILSEFIGFIHLYQPHTFFQNLLNALEESIPNLFKAIAIDLKDSESGQKELFSCLLKPCCESFRDDAILLIFPYMRSMHNDRSICKLFTELKQKRISYHTFLQLLFMVLQLPVHRSTWDKLTKYELPRFLESAQSLPPELLSAIFHLFDDRKKMQPDIVIKAFLNLLRLGYDKEQIKSSLESYIKVHRQSAFIYFNELVSIGLFAPQMLWTVFSNSPLEPGEIQFLNDLSSWCMEKDETMKPILEQYWSEVSKQQKLPQSILEQYKLLPAVVEAVKIVEVAEIQKTVAEIPSMSYFETIFRSVIDKYEDAYQHNISKLSLADFWMYLNSVRFFELDTTALTKNDIKLFVDFLYPKFKVASIHDIIPIMTGLFELITIEMSEEFKDLFEKMVFEDSLLENSMTYVLDNSTCVYEKWQCLEVLLFCSHQYISSECKVEIKRRIVEAIVMKSMLNPKAEENILILRNIFCLLNDISPETFIFFLKTFSSIMKGKPHLYVVSEKNKNPLSFWEELLIPFYKLMNVEWAQSPNRLHWFKKMEVHYLKFDNPVLTPQIAQKYAELSENLTSCSGASLMMMQLKKRIEAFQKTPTQENLVIDWRDIWLEMHNFPWSTEQCWELFKIFSSAIKIPLPSNNYVSLFPTLDNKISGFYYMQKLVFDSITLAILSGAYNDNFDQNFKNIRMLHVNFIQFYKWMQGQYQKSPNDEVLVDMNQVLKIHLCMHMSCLTTVRHTSKSFYEEYGSLNVELVDFVIKNQVVFEYNEAHSFICETGFISFDPAKRKKFLALISGFAMSGGAITPVPKFNINERENIIILFVLKGLQELMIAGELKKVHESMRELLPLHPALSSPVAIDNVVNYMDQNLAIAPIPDAASQILRIICYAYLVIDICEYSMSRPKIKHGVRLVKPICQLPGIEKFMRFTEQSQHPFVIEHGAPLNLKLLNVSERYEKWQNRRT